MNKQEIFNTVATHLFTQGKKAVSTSGSCMYRGPDYTKCAVGCLIPDENYVPKMEHNGVVGLMEYFDLPTAIFNEVNLPILSNLQLIHDDLGEVSTEVWDSTDGMKKKLSQVAERYDLKDHVLTNLHFSDR